MDTKKIASYTVLFERATEGGYIASVPLLPGCMTQGETFEEAKEKIKDAISGYLSVLQEDGDEIPVEQEEHIAATVTVPMPLHA
ncbi:MAG: type II toxin-antitoxin system HicB family antitoxin [bacterium]|nr:type II toxin-antitoxin system HicB family antitoxin [bacterium]